MSYFYTFHNPLEQVTLSRQLLAEMPPPAKADLENDLAIFGRNWEVQVSAGNEKIWIRWASDQALMWSQLPGAPSWIAEGSTSVASSGQLHGVPKGTTKSLRGPRDPKSH